MDFLVWYFRVHTSRDRRVVFCEAVGCRHVLWRAYTWSDMMKSYGGARIAGEAYPEADMLNCKTFLQRCIPVRLQ